MIDLLKESTVFKQLKTEELEEIAKICGYVRLHAGDQIFKAGEDATSLYIVNGGTVELKFTVYHFNAPADLTLDKMTKGDTFGWSAFAEPFKYTLSAYAVEDTELFQFPAEDFRELCRKNQHLGYVIMHNIATIISGRFSRFQGLLRHVIQGYLDKRENK